MGGLQHDPFRFTFNGSLKVAFQGRASPVTLWLQFQRGLSEGDWERKNVRRKTPAVREDIGV